MILNCGAVFVQWRPSSYSRRIVCLASPEQLRQQLDNLHKEANSTRAQANNARSRLVRLSEAAEKFRRQAATDVQTGKEDDARKLLLQKRKIMQAMETLKSRIELFDELSAKLNEAISIKEGLLIGNIALDFEVNEVEAASSIRIVSPKEENPNKSDEDQESESDQLRLEEDQGFRILLESESESESQIEGDIYAENELKKTTPSSIPRGSNDLNGNQHRREISSYEDFLKHIDQQLKQIEEQLENFLTVSALLLESKEKPKNLKVQHVTDVLEGIHETRQRLAAINQSKLDMNKVLD